MDRSNGSKRIEFYGQARQRWMLWVVLAILASLPATVVKAAVTLSSFAAAGGDNQVLVTWQTATEFDSAGFIIWSSEFEDGPYDPISDFVPSQGDGVTGASYSFLDLEVENGIRYYYKLEAIALDQSSEYYGPISATAGIPTATATLGPTSTRTQSPTSPPSATAPTRTPTITRTLRTSRTPTATLSASLSQGTQVSSPVPGSTQSGYPPPEQAGDTPYPMVEIDGSAIPSVVSQEDASPSATSKGSKKTPSATPEVVSMNSGQAGASGAENTSANPAGAGRLPRYFALLVVLLVWILLAGWFVSSWRRME